MKIAQWNVQVRFVVKCAYCGKFTEASDTCKTASEAVKECMEYGDALEYLGVMCSKCRYEADKHVERRGDHQVIDFGAYEEWRRVYADGTFGILTIVMCDEYPRCAECNQMWSAMAPGLSVCPDCNTSNIEDTKRQERLNSQCP